MKKKIISILVILLAIGAFIINHFISYASVSTPPIYVGLTKADLNGMGYGISNPYNGGEYIWNISTYAYNTTTQQYTTSSDIQKNLYCVKADYGKTWFGTETTTGDATAILGYELYYDLQTDRNYLLTNFANDEVITDLLATGLNGIYEELLWLFDNTYIKGVSNLDDYLAKVGIEEITYEGNTYYETSDGEYLGTVKLTESDIIAIQRMAIWYFTNGEENEVFDKTGDNETTWLFISEDSGSSYKGLSTTYESRNNMAMYLYDYLIDGAVAGASQYTSENNYTISGVPASVNTTGLTLVDGEYVLSSNRLGSNYLIGPIVINQNNNLDYDIAITVTDEDEETLDSSKYSFVDVNGNKLTYTTLKDLVGENGFYISVERNTVESIDVKIEISYETTTKRLWLDGSEDADGITLNSEQPLVEVAKEKPTETVYFTAQPEEFDLALRKYITAVNGVELTNTDVRVPNIDLSTLQTGTTATYKHKKDPVVVEDGAEVTYKITIYNEGTKSGYATKIIDQLPTGLISSTNNSSVVTSVGADGKERNQYKLQYDSYNNQIILTLIQWPEELEQNETEDYVKSIEPYTIGDLDYETIEIKCMVAQEPDTKNQIVLTNVAWIAAAYDSETGIEILTEGQDRDSEPQTSPSVDKGSMENYRGSTTGNELSDSTYFYEGQQDDDDFEKIVIMPVVKRFDLALFKHIAAISKDQNIEAGEYITDTGNIDGTYLRAPVVTAIDPTTGKITYEQDDKDALTVEPGDYVLYTIRVYNEGEVNGYASKIKDTLPIGLKFVVGNEEYNGIWTLEGLDDDGRQVVTTTWYAKGQGAELDAEEGDANYQANLLKALKKDGAISAENPDYIDAQVLCQVVEQATSNRVLVNYAQISDDTDENGEPIDDIDSTPDRWIDEEDDQDIERIKLQCFDLSLRKFITSVNGEEPKTSRTPVVDVSNLINGNDSTAVYNHSKQPLGVQVGDKIVYTIRVYNEGDINGYASEITDYLPEYLTYIENSEINKKYEWQISEDGRSVTTSYLANTELEAFDGTELDYLDVQIECLVSESAPLKEKQTNIAEISEYKYNGNVVEKDIDSTADNMVSKDYLPSDEELPSYKDDKIDNSYVPGNEDDDDFEKIYVQEFDLALRKFITQVQDKEVTTRLPQVKNENGKISYEHTKDALIVHVDDVVIYTLRIYNEGEISGYASEISDDIPEYLEYLPQNSTNIDYMWKMYNENGEQTENIQEAVKVKTEYLSKENGENNLIKAFDGTTLYYQDIKIAFKVKDPNSNKYIITNYAQISDDTDENGNSIKDNDSITDKWNDGEDDQDIENIKVEYFDLALLKFVSKVIVIEDGKETITETGYNGYEDPEPVVKVELHKKKLNEVVVKFGYGITITNEGDIAGYATEITDYVPEGLKFDPTDNPEWTDEGNNVISTKQTEGILLQPGESTTVEVIFTWINGANNLALKTNTAEISEDKNEYNVPDRDSTPDNKKDGEDDIDIAKVILAISTGMAKTYFTLTLGLLAVVLVGVVLIKKFVI